MGKYKNTKIRAELVENLPEEYIMILSYLRDYHSMTPHFTLPDHQFFRTKKWRFIGHINSRESNTGSSLFFIRLEHGYAVEVECTLDGYDDEVNFFFDWIKPYILRLNKFKITLK